MNVAIFGGTFDPVHFGHLAVAQAAQKKFRLGRVYFVPADVPPHKRAQPIAAYYHRYAMLALATAGKKGFLPSPIEALESLPGTASEAHGVSYSIDTVKRFKATLSPGDRLFFLIGIDAFMDIAKWREPEALLRAVDFIVASRPGFSLADVAQALPAGVRPHALSIDDLRRFNRQGRISLEGISIYLLSGVKSPVSATAIREAAARGGSLRRLVPAAVGEYIQKMQLYRPEQVSPPSS